MDNREEVKKIRFLRLLGTIKIKNKVIMEDSTFRSLGPAGEDDFALPVGPIFFYQPGNILGIILPHDD
jgi:hypothetical protein